MKETSLTWAKTEVFNQLSSNYPDIPAATLHKVVDGLFTKVSGKDRWRQEEVFCSFGLVYAMGTIQATKPQNLDWQKYVQSLDPWIFNTQMQIVCGSVDVPDMQLIQYIAHDFFRGNEAPMKAFLRESITEATALGMRRDALYAVRDISLLYLYTSKTETMDTAAKIKKRCVKNLETPVGKVAPAVNSALIDGIQDMVNESSSLSPMTLGWARNFKRQPKDFRPIAESLTRTLPEGILLGCIMLYLDRAPLAFTAAFFKSFLSTTFQIPIPDPRLGTHLRGLPDQKLFEEDDIDLFSGAFQVACLNGVMEDLTVDEIETQSDFFETVYMNPARVISLVSGCPVYFNVPFSRTLEHWFMEHGASEMDAHDFAVIAGTLRCTHNRMLSPVTVDVSPKNDELDQLKKQLDTARGQVNSFQKKVKELESNYAKSEKARRQAEYSMKRAQENRPDGAGIALLTEENTRLTIALEELTNAMAVDVQVPEQPVQFPYHTDKKVVLFGGHDVFHKMISKYLPDIKIIPPSDSSLDVTPIRGADLVCLQCNKCNHGQYWAAVAAAKAHGRKLAHLRYANAELCARVIVQELEQMQKGPENTAV